MPMGLPIKWEANSYRKGGGERKGEGKGKGRERKEIKIERRRKKKRESGRKINLCFEGWNSLSKEVKSWVIHQEVGILPSLVYFPP